MDELIEPLLCKIYRNKLVELDISYAKSIISYFEMEDFPTWIHVIAGGNPENLEEVLKTAREELGHELLGTDNDEIATAVKLPRNDTEPEEVKG